MARMTGVVSAMTNAFMGEMERKRQMQEQQLEQERERAAMASMFSAMYPGQQMPPQAFTPQTFPQAVSKMNQRATQKSMLDRTKATTQAQLDRDELEKLQKEEENRAKTAAKIKAIKTVYPKYLPQLGYDIYDDDTAELALKDIGRMQQSESYKENQTSQIEKERQMIDYRESKNQTAKPTFLDGVTMKEIGKVVARNFVQYIPPEKKTDYPPQDFTDYDTVRSLVPTEIQNQMDTVTSQLIQKATSGGSGALYPQNIRPGQTAPQQLPNSPIPTGAILQSNMQTKDGKPVYKLPNGQYWTPE